MNITFDELRKIKHQLPTGGVAKIAEKLGIDEQTVRNYFGAQKFENGELVANHIQPGPNGGIVHIEDDTILNIAKEIIAEYKTAAV
jgi:predicted transcriptional regulator